MPLISIKIMLKNHTTNIVKYYDYFGSDVKMLYGMYSN